MSEYYVSGCKSIDGDIVTCDDSEAEFWTLYQRKDGGLSHALIDCTDRLGADEAMKVYVDRDYLQQKLDAVVAEIARRDAIFIPVYPCENLMYRLIDVFHDTAKIHCDEDSLHVENPELVITATLNHFMQSNDSNCLAAENMALRKFIRESCYGYNGDGSDISYAYTPAEESPHFPSCPATEKVINWFKAEGVEMFANESAALRKSHFASGDREMAINADHRFLLASTFADELRADAAKGVSDEPA